MHSWTSLACTLFLLVLALSGLPLIFHDEIRAWLDPPAPPPMPPIAPLDLDRVVEAAHRHRPSDTVRSLYRDEHRPHVVRLELVRALDVDPDRGRWIAVDSHTGAVLVERAPERTYMHLLVKVHTELLAGAGGTAVLGGAGALFVVAVVSGAVVYGPFAGDRPFGSVRRDRAARVRWLDRHNVLGIVTLAWALVVGLTGVVNTLAGSLRSHWQEHTLPAVLAPYANQPLPARAGSVQAAVDTARATLPDARVLSVVLPNPRTGSPRHYLVWTGGGTLLTARLSTPVLIDAATGRLATIAHLPWSLTVLELSRPLHFGNFGGWPLKILWALLDVGTIVVLASGVYLWLARRGSPM